MKTILQIEDNLANKILVERVLSRFDYQLLHAADGETGVTIAIEESPDLILVDMGLLYKKVYHYITLLSTS